MAAVSGSEAEDSAVAGDAVVVGAVVVVERPEVGTPVIGPVIGPDIADTRLLGSLLVPLKK
jgi:hypothetical protein